jgi:hypothetical protein
MGEIRKEGEEGKFAHITREWIGNTSIKMEKSYMNHGFSTLAVRSHSLGAFQEYFAYLSTQINGIVIFCLGLRCIGQKY